MCPFWDPTAFVPASGVSSEPLGDGPQRVVSRNGHRVGYFAGLDDLAALGVDLSRMEVVDRWLSAPAQPGGLPLANTSAAPPSVP